MMKLFIPEDHKPYSPLYERSGHRPLYDRNEQFQHFDPSIKEYDAITLGGGGAGGVGSSYLKAKGKKVLTIESDDHLGGKCPKNACIPHHLFFDCATELDLARWMGGRLWFEPFDKRVEIRPIFQFFQESHEPFYDYIFSRFKDQMGIKFFLNTRAEIVSAQNVKAGGHTFTTKNLIISTGSSPAKLGLSGEDLPGVFDHTNLMSIDYEPENVVVVGASKVGAPFACFFNACGIQTSLVEMTPFFPFLDEDIRDYIVHGMMLRGMTLYGKTRILAIEGNEHVENVIVETPEGEIKIPCDTVFIAAGTKPNSGVAAPLGLKLGPNGEIEVNSRMQTSVPGVFAAGDVIGPPMEMWKARQSGIIAAKNILGEDAELDLDNYPDSMHTTYEISWCGLTEKEAREKYGDIIKVRLPAEASPRNLAFPLAERTVLFGHAFPELLGMQKAIFDRASRRLVGAWHVGYGAKDSFQYIAELMKREITIDELARMKELHLNPTHFIQASRSAV